MGAIASGGVRVLNQEVVQTLNISEEQLAAIAAAEQEELDRRARLYRGDRPPPDVKGRTAILIDDGLATGATMRAAVAALRQRGAAKIVVAVPVGPPDTCKEFEDVADEVVCASAPEFFQAVGQYYEDFSQTSDQEVRDLLARAAREG